MSWPSFFIFFNCLPCFNRITPCLAVLPSHRLEWRRHGLERLARAGGRAANSHSKPRPGTPDACDAHSARSFCKPELAASATPSRGCKATKARGGSERALLASWDGSCSRSGRSTCIRLLAAAHLRMWQVRQWPSLKCTCRCNAVHDAVHPRLASNQTNPTARIMSGGSQSPNRPATCLCAPGFCTLRRAK